MWVRKEKTPCPTTISSSTILFESPITRFGDDIVINGEALGRESWHHQVCWIFLPNNGLLNGLLNGFLNLFL
jgi:hypothetical protein